MYLVNWDGVKVKKLKCSPGDIISEMIGEVEASRYIIIEKGISIDYRRHEYSIYRGYLIYVCKDWEDLHKVGTTWLINDEQFESGGLEMKVIFKSGLSWKNFDTKKEL